MTTAGKLRGAFIGFGNVASLGHLPGWLTCQDAEIVAATDATASRREAFLAACPRGTWFDDVAGLVASGQVDFVDICTPPGSHAALISQALGAGLHVLCEKPLVTQASDAKALAAARGDRVVHTVHNWLEAPLCRRISSLLAEKAIGSVRRLEWRTLRTQPAVAVAIPGAENWRIDPAMAGGGILFDHGWHALYCVLHWAGSRPDRLAASLETRKFHEWPLEDTATIDLNFPAARGRVFLTWTADERANLIEIEGTDGAILTEGAAVVLKNKSGERRWACPPALSEGSHHPDWFSGVAAEFLSAVAKQGQGNLQEALLCAKLIDLAQRSSAAGGVKLPA